MGSHAVRVAAAAAAAAAAKKGSHLASQSRCTHPTPLFQTAQRYVSSSQLPTLTRLSRQPLTILSVSNPQAYFLVI